MMAGVTRMTKITGMTRVTRMTGMTKTTGMTRLTGTQLFRSMKKCPTNVLKGLIFLDIFFCFVMTE